MTQSWNDVSDAQFMKGDPEVAGAIASMQEININQNASLTFLPAVNSIVRSFLGWRPSQFPFTAIFANLLGWVLVHNNLSVNSIGVCF